jgi:hypothetical protein
MASRHIKFVIAGLDPAIPLREALRSSHEVDAMPA